MFRKQNDYTEEMVGQLNEKLAEFYNRIHGKKIIIGFTGGLKSFMLAELARPVVTEMKCIFIETSYTSPQDLNHVTEFMNSADHAFMNVQIIQDLELNQNILVLNSDERDFFCKKGITDIISELRVKFEYDLIIDGTDSQQYQDFWNSKQQFGDSYFMIGNLGISRDDVVHLSKSHGFKFRRHPEINLLSRFAYNIPLTGELLKTVVDLERYIKDLTNIKLLRVRVIDKEHAIIEVRQKELPRLLDEKTRKKIFTEFSEKGFASINVDLAGYRKNNLFHPGKS